MSSNLGADEGRPISAGLKAMWMPAAIRQEALVSTMACCDALDCVGVSVGRFLNGGSLGVAGARATRHVMPCRGSTPNRWRRCCWVPSFPPQ